MVTVVHKPDVFALKELVTAILLPSIFFPQLYTVKQEFSSLGPKDQCLIAIDALRTERLSSTITFPYSGITVEVECPHSVVIPLGIIGNTVQLLHSLSTTPRDWWYLVTGPSPHRPPHRVGIQIPHVW
jgi:hypothetical protein